MGDLFCLSREAAEAADVELEAREWDDVELEEAGAASLAVCFEEAADAFWDSLTVLITAVFSNRTTRWEYGGMNVDKSALDLGWDCEGRFGMEALSEYTTGLCT